MTQGDVTSPNSRASLAQEFAAHDGRGVRPSMKQIMSLMRAAAHLKDSAQRTAELTFTSPGKLGT